MWIVLNIQKAHRFTTQGINLHKGAPTAFVDPGLPAEVLDTIERAVGDGRILSVASNEMAGLAIPNQAKIEKVKENQTDLQAGISHQRDNRGRILATTITMPDREGNAVEKDTTPIIIMTGIYEAERDEEAD